MKKIYSILFCVASVVCITSCSDKFLDVQPSGMLTPEVYFENESNIEYALNRVYSSINWRFYRLGGWHFATREMCADDFVPASFADYKAIQHFEYLDNNYLIERYWDRMYGYFNDCNQVIDLAANLTDKDLANRAEAQAKYFRAYYNFDMWNVLANSRCATMYRLPTNMIYPAIPKMRFFNSSLLI